MLVRAKDAGIRCEVAACRRIFKKGLFPLPVISNREYVSPAANRAKGFFRAISRYFTICEWHLLRCIRPNHLMVIRLPLSAIPEQPRPAAACLLWPCRVFYALRMKDSVPKCKPGAGKVKPPAAPVLNAPRGRLQISFRLPADCAQNCGLALQRHTPFWVLFHHFRYA